jgi:hypothetical protein
MGIKLCLLPLKEERWVFENRLLRRMFGLKRKGVTGGWRKLHNEELCNLYSSQNIFLRHLQSFADLWPTLMGFSIYI